MSRHEPSFWTIVILFIILFIMVNVKTVCGDNRIYRENKDLFVSSTVGVHIPTLVAIPVQLGYYSDADALYGLEYASRSFEYDDKNVVVTDGLVSNTGVFLRWFISPSWFESLNVYSSFNKRNFNVDVRVRIDDNMNTPFGGDAKYTDSNLKVEAYTVSFGIGNQWMWKNGVFIGIDYMVGTKIISSKIESSISANGKDYVRGTELRDAESDLNNLGTTIENIIEYNGYAMITLGWAF